MNIIYKYETNNGLKYIGSKTECVVVDNTVVDRYGKDYYGSTKSKDFFVGILAGYSLEILEVVGDKSDILKREAFYQRKYNAIEDETYVNLVYADKINNVISTERWNEIVNPYMETLKDFTVRASAVARLESSAEKLGYSTYGHLVKSCLELIESGKTFKEVDGFLGKKKFTSRFLSGKTLEDYDQPFCKKELVGFLLKGKSLIRACEDLGVGLHVVLYKMPKDFYKINRKLRLAIDNGFYSRTEFEHNIMYLFLDGYSRKDIAENFNNVSISTVSRIIDKIIKNRLEINDFK